MKRYRQSDRTKPAFTLVEIVTVIAIIAILAAILVPALSLAMKMAMNVKQKGQFHSIDFALEAFRTDFGDYPESTGQNRTLYCGAQRLAEAVIGYDGFGFHPKSVFAEDGTIPDPTNPTQRINIYLPAVTGPARDDSLRSRKGPYLELETAGAVKLVDLYGTGGAGNLENTFVLTDAYGLVTHRLTKKHVGMPILYYKADVSAFEHDSTLVYAPPDPTGLRRNIIDLQNNLPIINLPVPFNKSLFHPLRGKDNEYKFYDATANPNFSNPVRPYRSESFILHSAGSDGLYGTPDDLFNFEPGK